jgi:AraC family transcriptional regulator, regulatory protein of adaptative response / methylated-DNA-[protein]-cysteine methyltransferase
MITSMAAKPTTMSRPLSAEAASIERDPRWAAVAARDRGADGTFFYSVDTTGVYCRPSCASRRANPRNVRFHRTAADAERAGFRPCRRCRPGEPALEHVHVDKIVKICREIERAETTPTLAALARRAGLSPHHLHRVFKAVTGLTPRGYAAAHRSRRVRRQLEDTTRTVTDAIYEAGFNSSGRFYETAGEVLGMTPTAYRAGGVDTEIRFAVGRCSLGSILVAQSARGVCAISLGDDPDALVQGLQDRFPRATLIAGDTAFEQTVARVVALVETPSRGCDLPLDVRGTAFQQRVWEALRRIPPGTTVSYAELAARVGAPGGARAVAQACAANTLAVAIPCHRVVRTDGALSGYRWGVERKRRLLEREGRA